MGDIGWSSRSRSQARRNRPNAPLREVALTPCRPLQVFLLAPGTVAVKSTYGDGKGQGTVTILFPTE